MYDLSDVTEDVKLSMSYIKSIKKWAIEVHRGKSQGPKLFLPPIATLEKLWQENAPGRSPLWLRTIGHDFPILENALVVGGGQGSKFRERKKFLAAVLTKCRIATPQLPGAYNPGAL